MDSPSCPGRAAVWRRSIRSISLRSAFGQVLFGDPGVVAGDHGGQLVQQGIGQEQAAGQGVGEHLGEDTWSDPLKARG
jgi:hypothetical protein